MLPEAEYIKKEHTLRIMALPDDVLLTKASLVRWVALALGLIKPNETRTYVLDIFNVMCNARKAKEWLDVEQIHARVNKGREKPIDEKTVYYHILKMKNKGILTKKGKTYLLGREDMSLSMFVKLYITRDVEDYLDALSKALDALES